MNEYWVSVGNFHVLGLFIAKKHDLSEKKISVCQAPLPLNATPLKARKLKFRLPESFAPKKH
jgi:hypothetical protein